MPLAKNTAQPAHSMASVKCWLQNVKTMSKSLRITQIFFRVLMNTTPMKTIRAPLAAIALFCLTVALAPQAVAQACGPALTLSANQWAMVGIPCVPPQANQTVGDVFGPSLGAADYGVTWIVWERIYGDNNQCVVASGPSDCYKKLTLASAATTGDAFWIFTTVEKKLQFSSITTSTPGPFEFPANLSTDGNSRYYMFANPYSATVNWADMLFPTLLFGFFDVDLTVQQAINNAIVSKNVHYWNGNTYFTRDLTAPAATFEAKEAAWLEMLQPNAFVFQNVNVLVLQP